MWSETFERPLTDVLNVQRDIAEKITHSLSIQLLPHENSRSASAPANFESYDKYLLGLHELGQGTRDSESKAIQYFQEALAKDPSDARLHAALAEGYFELTTWYGSPNETMPKAKAEALRALELDPNLASAHALLGYVQLLFDWNWPAAKQEFRKALDMNPSLPDAQLGYATYLATLGQFDEAIARVQQAYLFDPVAPGSRGEALWIYYFSGRMPETVEQARKTIELEPAAGLPYSVLALAYAQMGSAAETRQTAETAVRFANSPSVLTTAASALAHIGQSAESKKILNQALQQAKERYACRFIVAGAYMELGDREKAFESLDEAFL